MRRRRGIVLITSIALAVVMVMFVVAALNLGLGSLTAGKLAIDELQAERAAQSGLEYCLAQLKRNPAWRADKNEVTVNRADLVVREDEGNLVGLLRTPDGQWTQFRCRFNYQDGPGGLDGFANDPAFSIDHAYVCVNNLQGAAPVDVPRADGPGYSVTAGSEVAFQIPTWTVCLAVEGRGGLRGVDPANPEGPFPTSRRRLVEAVYQITGTNADVFVEAGSMAGKDFRARLDAGAVEVTSSTPTTPRLRAKGQVSVTGGAPQNYVSPQGEVRASLDGNGDPRVVASYDATQVFATEEPALDPFFQLAWAQVRQADPAFPLPAGTYVWWDDGTLHYYDMAFADYVAFMQDPANVNKPGVTPPLLPPTLEALSQGGKMKLLVTGDVLLEASPSGVTELAVIPRLGAEEAPPGDPEAGGGGDPAVSAATTLGPSIAPGGQFHQFLLQYQGASGEIDIEINDSTDWAEVKWDGTSITFAGPCPPQDLMHKIWDVSFGGPTWQWDGGGTAYGSTAYAPANFDHNDAAAYFSLSGGGPPQGAVDPPGVSDGLSAADLELEFAPPAGTSAVISGAADIRLTGSILGEGGSIVSGGNIRITGLGASIASQENPVNLYAVGDIFFSTLDKPNTGQYAYRDVNLKGIVYTQRDFIARLGSDALPGKWGKLNLEGMLIAYGGDPGGVPGASGKGNVDISASGVRLIYNSAYLGSLFSAPPPQFQVRRVSWSNRL